MDRLHVGIRFSCALTGIDVELEDSNACRRKHFSENSEELETQDYNLLLFYLR